MTIQDMHIEVAQATQNIAANVRRKLLRDEIDWLLNKNQQRFIESKVKPRKDGSGGFSIDQVDLDAIRTLLVKTDVSPNRVNDRYMAQLPGDYAYLIADTSRTVNLCGSTTQGTSGNIPVLKLKLNNTSKADPKYFANVSITVGEDTYALADIIQRNGLSAFAGFDGKSFTERRMIADLFFWHLRHVAKLDVYWEQYATLNEPWTFLILNQTEGSITIDGGNVTPGNVVNVQYIYHINGTGVWRENRLTPSARIAGVLQAPFYGTSHLSPVSELIGRELSVFASESFIVNRIGLTYIRKARSLSLPLGESCELPSDFHNAICDLTVEYFKAMTADPTWEIKLRDNVARSLPIQ